MIEGKTVSVIFQGIHVPTGCEIDIMIRWDGKDTELVGDRQCPVCRAIDEWSYIQRIGNMGNARDAVQCRGCYSWFVRDVVPGTKDDIVAIRFE